MQNGEIRNRREFLDSAGMAARSSVVAVVLAQIAGIRKAVASSAPVQEENAPIDFEMRAKQYSLSPDVNYLNHASIGTIAKPVQDARISYLNLCETNPWFHMWGDAWKEPVEHVRQSAAEFLGCAPKEVAITHNTTEMFNTLANGLPLRPQDEVLFSTLCHAGASLPFLHRAGRQKYKARRIEFPVAQLPSITAEQIVEVYSRQIKSNTRVIAIPHLDNTLGVRYPVKQLADMARSQGVDFVLVDAAQTAGMISLNCAEWNVDVVATSGHKWLGGPKGTGLAYVAEHLHDKLDPMWVTWGQERWPRSARWFEDYGTRNVPEVLTLGDAITFTGALDSKTREDRLQELWAFTRKLIEQHETLQWNSPADWELSGSLYSIRVTRPAEELAKDLFEQHGIVVRPFTTLGLNNLRVSPNVFTSKDQIKKLIELIS